MEVTNAELAELLNGEAGLAGADAVTVNVIRQWVAWDVLPKATITGRSGNGGPLWSRSPIAVRRARRLAELRALGIRREAAVIVQAYIEWGHRDFARVRSALLSEIGKWRAQLTHHRTTYMDKAKYGDMSTASRRAMKTQLGPIDNRFMNTKLQQSDEFYAVFTQLAESGKGDPDYANRLLFEAFGRVLPELPLFQGSEQISGLLSLIAGVFGSPDEIANSAQSEIENCCERDLRIARANTRHIYRLIRQAPQILKIPDIKALFGDFLEMPISISKQISVGPWAIFQLVACLLAVKRNYQWPEMTVNSEIFDRFLQT